VHKNTVKVDKQVDAELIVYVLKIEDYLYKSMDSDDEYEPWNDDNKSMASTSRGCSRLTNIHIHNSVNYYWQMFRQKICPRIFSIYRNSSN